MNQRYVISTTTKVSVAGVDVKAIEDAFFAREAAPKKKSTDEAMFDQTPKATVTSAARKAAQTTVDAALKANIDKVDKLSAYLSAKFSLGKYDKPHAMVF